MSSIAGGAVDIVIVSRQLMDQNRLQEIEQACAVHGVTLQRLHFRLEQVTAAS